MATLNPSYLMIGFLKNFTYNMPTWCIAGSEDAIATFVQRAAVLLNVDITNEAISEGGGKFWMLAPHSYGCDLSVNPIIIWLLCGCLVLLAISGKKIYKTKMHIGFCISGILSFLVFCVVLRWEPFICRYMICFLALLCPICAYLIQNLIFSDKGKTAIFAIVIFLAAMDMLGVLNYNLQLALNNSRYQGSFYEEPGRYERFRAAAEIINEKGYQSIGIIKGETEFEYPFLKMVSCNEIAHINVENTSAVYENNTFIPEAVVVFWKSDEKTIWVHDMIYRKTSSEEDAVEIYVRD